MLSTCTPTYMYSISLKVIDMVKEETVTTKARGKGGPGQLRLYNTNESCLAHYNAHVLMWTWPRSNHAMYDCMLSYF